MLHCHSDCPRPLYKKKSASVRFIRVVRIAIESTGEIYGALYEGKSASVRFIRVVRVAIESTREIYGALYERKAAEIRLAIDSCESRSHSQLATRHLHLHIHIPLKPVFQHHQHPDM